ncbi:hypothetical protein J6590_086270 [Homalodisca vitripennis]|nr:hypothetical protein J6590_086270 [Homalodisca vitripennis]
MESVLPELAMQYSSQAQCDNRKCNCRWNRDFLNWQCNIAAKLNVTTENAIVNIQGGVQNTINRNQSLGILGEDEQLYGKIHKLKTVKEGQGSHLGELYRRWRATVTSSRPKTNNTVRDKLTRNKIHKQEWREAILHRSHVM